MLEGIPSRTARGAALLRAAHQLVDRPPVFEDPLAMRIVGEEAAAALRDGRDPRAGPGMAALRAFVAVRSRFAEDQLTAAHARGTRQYVVLGAGLDTFACRGGLEDVRVVEVDHPATQAWKRARLAEAGVAVPDRLAFAAVDLAREPLAPALAGAGLDRARPAFVAWLGVTPYLAAAAVRATLEALGRGLGPGSELVFDFAAPAPDPAGQAAREALGHRVAAVGEPLRSAFEPAEVLAALRAGGWAPLALLDAAALNARYLSGRADGLTLRGGHLVHARLDGP